MRDITRILHQDRSDTTGPGEATAQAQPNIALVKYWGKRPASDNVPAVASLSITLDALWTRTRVRFDPGSKRDELFLDGRPVEGEERTRVSHCLDRLRRLGGRSDAATVISENNFPTGAGLASSASGFAALVTAASAALGLDIDSAGHSQLARASSASAARSIFGGFVELPVAGIENPFARQVCPASDWPLRVLVAVTSESKKHIGSTRGMNLGAATSPYYEAWLDTSEADFAAARAAVLARDFEALAEVSEHSCLKMHAVMMSSQPGLLYWNGASTDCIQTIRSLRNEGVGVFFTLDAGPQVKAVCEPEAVPAVRAALGRIGGVHKLLESNLGAGAQVVAA